MAGEDEVGYIAYDPQEDTETICASISREMRGSYIAYDPQEDTETRCPPRPP